MHSTCAPLGPLFHDLLDPEQACGLLFAAAQVTVAQTINAACYYEPGEHARFLFLLQTTSRAFIGTVG